MKIIFFYLFLVISLPAFSQPFTDYTEKSGLPTSTFYGGVLFFQSDIDSLDLIKMGSSGVGPTIHKIYSIENSIFREYSPKIDINFSDTSFYINDQYYDLNSDGFIDLIGFYPRRKKGMMIFWGSPSGFSYENNTAIPDTFLTVYNDPYRIIPVDFNRDGKLDLLSDNYYTQNRVIVNYYESTGSKTFLKKDYWPFFDGVTEYDEASILPFDDINHDGIIDYSMNRLFVSYKNGRNWSPLIGNLRYFLNSGMKLIDLDSDGTIEVFERNGDINEQGIYILRPGIYRIKDSGSVFERFVFEDSEQEIMGMYPDFIDFNNDGLPDLVTFSWDETVSAGLYINQGYYDGHFHFKTAGTDAFQPNTTPGYMSHGYVDINYDGLTDVLVIPSIFNPGKIQVYLNENVEGNNFIKIILKPTKSRSDLEGANIEIVSSAEDIWSHQRFIHNNNKFFLSRIPNFGLGKTEVLDTVKVIWPSGIIDILTGVKANQTLRIYEGETHTLVENLNNSKPGFFQLEQNFPNPFNPETSIPFYLSNAAFVKISIFNQLGQTVSELVNKTLNSGKHTVQFNGSAFPSGLYFYRMVVNGKTETRKMVLMK